MKKYSKQEIEDQVKKIWGTDEPDTIRVSIGSDEVNIELSSMYQAPGLNFAKLKALSDFFETDHIDDEERFSNGGCESCDYGSNYGFTLTIK
jgi:hypothetical protein